MRRRSDVRHFVGIREREQPLPSAADASPEDLERMGPRFLLEINTVTAEQSLVIGGSDKAVIDAWLSALARAVAHVAATSNETEEEPHGMPSLLSENILRLELTGAPAARRRPRRLCTPPRPGWQASWRSGTSRRRATV